MTSTGKFYTVLNSLKQQGLVKEQAVNLGGRGGSATFLEITEKGCEAIDRPPKPYLTRGGNFITDIWITKVQAHLKEILNGWKINIEKQVQGKFMDMVLEGINQAGIIAIELELSDGNLKNNIEQDVTKVDFLIEACVDDLILKKAESMKQELQSEQQNKVGVCLLPKLLRCGRISEFIDSGILKERGL